MEGLARGSGPTKPDTKQGLCWLRWVNVTNILSSNLLFHLFPCQCCCLHFSPRNAERRGQETLAVTILLSTLWRCHQVTLQCQMVHTEGTTHLLIMHDCRGVAMMLVAGAHLVSFPCGNCCSQCYWHSGQWLSAKCLPHEQIEGGPMSQCQGGTFVLSLLQHPLFPFLPCTRDALFNAWFHVCPTFFCQVWQLPLPSLVVHSNNCDASPIL